MWNKKSAALTSTFLNLATAATQALITQVAEICTQKLNALQNHDYDAVKLGDFDEEKEVSILQQTAQTNAANAQNNYASVHSNDDDTNEKLSF